MSTMSTDHRRQAQETVETLVSRLRTQPPDALVNQLIDECEALVRAIGAFHMEGIRFRMFNVDRLLQKGAGVVPSDASAIFAEARRSLEAAGFHTRSHQAPG
jgi:hypothetical protein